MPEPSLLGGVFDTLTKPIRQRPIRSLVFFVALLCLGIGLFSRPVLKMPEPLHQTLATLLFVLPSAGIILSLHRLVVMRDEPSQLKDPAVLDRIKESFVGREEDTRSLTNLICTSYQVWLNGDSGVGKSVLLRKAILPELEKRKIPIIYLNSWRGDWEQTPASVVLEKLGKRPNGGSMDLLSRELGTSRDLVIIFDQFDEFQIEHRDKFIPPHGSVISRAQLEQTNQFFRILNSAVREQHVRCVFVARRDVEWGKRVVLFDDAAEFFLRRLPSNIVEAEIGRIVPRDAPHEPGQRLGCTPRTTLQRFGRRRYSPGPNAICCSRLGGVAAQPYQICLFPHWQRQRTCLSLH
jgi:Novel STAND NTPase 1